MNTTSPTNANITVTMTFSGDSAVNDYVLVAETLKSEQAFNKTKYYIDKLSKSRERTALVDRLTKIQIIN